MFSVEDSVDNGYEVGTVATTGGDGTSITFSIDDSTGTFTIDSNTGVVSVVNADNLYSGDIYSVTFHATQSGHTVDSGGTINVVASGWEVTKVTKKGGAAGAITKNDDIDVEVKKPKERNQIFEVRIILQKKNALGKWEPVLGAEKTFTVNDSKNLAKLTATFTKQPAGDYKALVQTDTGFGIFKWETKADKTFTVTD